MGVTDLERFGAQALLAQGIGTYRIDTFASPAVGAEYDAGIPGTGVLWLINFRDLLTTSAVVANRDTVWRVTDGATVLFEVAAAAPIGASITGGVHDWPAGIGQSQAGPSALTQVTCVPPLVLYPGYRIQSVTANLQGADQYSGLSLWTLEVPMGDLDRFLGEIGLYGREEG